MRETTLYTGLLLIILKHLDDGLWLRDFRLTKNISDVLQCDRSAGLSINAVPLHQFLLSHDLLKQNHMTLMRMMEFI